MAKLIDDTPSFGGTPLIRGCSQPPVFSCLSGLPEFPAMTMTVSGPVRAVPSLSSFTGLRLGMWRPNLLAQ